MNRVLWAWSIILVPVSMAAQTGDTSLVAVRDWLDQNVVSLAARPEEHSWSAILTFRVVGCNTLQSTWAVRGADGWRSSNVFMSTPISWRRVTVRSASSLPAQRAIISGGIQPVPKMIELAPAEAPGGAVVRLEYAEKPPSDFYLTMESWEAANQVKEKLTHLAKLCSAGQ